MLSEALERTVSKKRLWRKYTDVISFLVLFYSIISSVYQAKWVWKYGGGKVKKRQRRFRGLSLIFQFGLFPFTNYVKSTFAEAVQCWAKKLDSRLLDINKKMSCWALGSGCRIQSWAVTVTRNHDIHAAVRILPAVAQYHKMVLGHHRGIS